MEWKLVWPRVRDPHGELPWKLPSGMETDDRQRVRLHEDIPWKLPSGMETCNINIFFYFFVDLGNFLVEWKHRDKTRPVSASDPWKLPSGMETHVEAVALALDEALETS